MWIMERFLLPLQEMCGLQLSVQPPRAQTGDWVVKITDGKISGAIAGGDFTESRLIEALAAYIKNLQGRKAPKNIEA